MVMICLAFYLGICLISMAFLLFFGLMTEAFVKLLTS